MKKLTFYIVDVFAEKKYAGNQLAVFRQAGELNSDEMQQLARETNYSETSFTRHVFEKLNIYIVLP